MQSCQFLVCHRVLQSCWYMTHLTQSFSTRCLCVLLTSEIHRYLLSFDSSTAKKFGCFFVLTLIVCLPIQFQSLCCKCFAKIAENDDLKNMMLEKACIECNSIMAECLLLLGADINKKTKTNSLICQVIYGSIYNFIVLKFVLLSSFLFSCKLVFGRTQQQYPVQSNCDLSGVNHGYSW